MAVRNWESAGKQPIQGKRASRQLTGSRIRQGERVDKLPHGGAEVGKGRETRDIVAKKAIQDEIGERRGNPNLKANPVNCRELEKGKETAFA
jgi:hypothetical protein